MDEKGIWHSDDDKHIHDFCGKTSEGETNWKA